MNNCKRCEKEFDPEDNDEMQWQEHDKDRYCGSWCKKQADDAYDDYVDPYHHYHQHNPDRVTDW